MKRILGTLLLSMLMVIGLASAAVAGDLEIGLAYQGVSSDLNLDIADLVELSDGGDGSAATFSAKYWFTPRWFASADYTWGDFSHGILLNSDFNIMNIEVGYLHPFTDKFSFGGIVGYTSFSEEGDVIHHNLFNYEADVKGITLGLKSVYKATEKFSLSAGFNVMVSPNGDFDSMILDDTYISVPFLGTIGNMHPVTDASDAYYRQFVIEGRYQFTEHWAVNAGYKRVWTGYEVNYRGDTIDHFDTDVDHVFDGLYLGLIFTF